MDRKMFFKNHRPDLSPNRHIIDVSLLEIESYVSYSYRQIFSVWAEFNRVDQAFECPYAFEFHLN